MKYVFLPDTAKEAVFVAIAAGCLATIGYLAILDRQPITTNESAIITPLVPQGGEFRISYDVTWNSNCRLTGFRVIVDGKGYQHQITPDTRLVAEGQDQFDIVIPIPRSAATGKAFYRGVVEYACNAWQRVFPLVRTISQREFTIIPGASTQQLRFDPRGDMEACPSGQTFVRAYCRRDPRYTWSTRPSQQ